MTQAQTRPMTGNELKQLMARHGIAPYQAAQVFQDATETDIKVEMENHQVRPVIARAVRTLAHKARERAFDKLAGDLRSIHTKMQRGQQALVEAIEHYGYGSQQATRAGGDARIAVTMAEEERALEDLQELADEAMQEHDGNIIDRVDTLQAEHRATL